VDPLLTEKLSLLFRGCSKWIYGKAAGEKGPEAYPQGYVEDLLEPRTQQKTIFSIPGEGRCRQMSV
jgi:hypothetical protein